MLHVEIPKMHKYTVAFTDKDLPLLRLIQQHYTMQDGSPCGIERTIRFLVRDIGKTFKVAEAPANGSSIENKPVTSASVKKKKKSIGREQRPRRRAS